MENILGLTQPLYYVTDNRDAVGLPNYTAVIKIGNLYIQLIDKTFTQEQIDHMREYFGWEVKNLCNE